MLEPYLPQFPFKSSSSCKQVALSGRSLFEGPVALWVLGAAGCGGEGRADEQRRAARRFRLRGSFEIDAAAAEAGTRGTAGRYPADVQKLKRCLWDGLRQC